VAVINTISKHTINNFPTIWYDITNITTDHFWIQWRQHIFLQLLKKCSIDFSAPLLGCDIGCGNGLVQTLCEQHTQWIVDGVDINDHALTHNPSLRGETFYYDINECRSEMEEKYDFLILFDVLEHVEDVPFLDACLHMLKPGGYVFINIPALPFCTSKYDEAIGHVRRYTKKGITSLLHKNELRLHVLQYWAMGLIPFALCRRLLFGILPLNKDRMIRVGMEPVNSIVDRLFRMLMVAETRLLPTPPIGASIMSIATKEQ